MLSGEEEGAFAWIATNYLRGVFNDPDNKESVGVLEMGGASTQITFNPAVDALAGKFPVIIAGRVYPLYTHSYLGYGQATVVKYVREQLVKESPGETIILDPCALIGDEDEIEMELESEKKETVTFYGISDPPTCQRIIDEFVEKVPKEDCSQAPCGMKDVYQPTIPNLKELYAVGVYFYVARMVGLMGKSPERTVSPAQFQEHAEVYCAGNLDEAAAYFYNLTGKDNPYLSENCASALFISELLTESYMLPSDAAVVHVAESVDGTEVSWTLGALIYEEERSYSLLDKESGNRESEDTELLDSEINSEDKRNEDNIENSMILSLLRRIVEKRND